MLLPIHQLTCFSITYEFQPNPLYWPYCYFGPDNGSHRRHALQASDATPQDDISPNGNAHTTTIVQSLSVGALTAMATESPEASAEHGNAGIMDNYGTPYCFNVCHGVDRLVLGDASSVACDWMINIGSTFSTDADVKAFSW